MFDRTLTAPPEIFFGEPAATFEVPDAGFKFPASMLTAPSGRSFWLLTFFVIPGPDATRPLMPLNISTDFGVGAFSRPLFDFIFILPKNLHIYEANYIARRESDIHPALTLVPYGENY